MSKAAAIRMLSDLMLFMTCISVLCEPCPCSLPAIVFSDSCAPASDALLTPWGTDNLSLNILIFFSSANADATMNALSAIGSWHQIHALEQHSG